MGKAKTGDTVKVHYTGTLPDGTEFDSSSGRDPIEFTIGSGDIIPGFEKAAIGMEPGETKKVTVSTDEAYGERHDELVQTVDRGQIPDSIDVEVGMQLQATGPNDEQLVLTVVHLTDESVTLDANHPLAGQDLTFEIEMIEVR